MKKKVKPPGRPIIKKPHQKVSFNIEKELLGHIKKRMEKTGEDLSVILATSIRKEMNSYLKKEGLSPGDMLFCDSIIIEALRNCLSGFVAENTAVTIIDTACKTMNVIPSKMQKSDLTRIFINQVCSSIETLYSGDTERVAKCRKELNILRKRL